MVETSPSYGKLLDGFPLLPLLKINPAAQIIFFKSAFCFPLISVYLPTAQALVIAGLVTDEPQNILRRITQKQSDLMGKFLRSPEAVDQVQHTGVEIFRCVAILQQQFPDTLICQIAFQRMRAVERRLEHDPRKP